MKASKIVVEGSQAVAEAVRLCRPEVIPVYPITHIVETIAQMVADGKMDSEIVRVESEQSAMAACIGSQATGVRSYTATASPRTGAVWDTASQSNPNKAIAR